MAQRQAELPGLQEQARLRHAQQVALAEVEFQRAMHDFESNAEGRQRLRQSYDADVREWRTKRADAEARLAAWMDDPRQLKLARTRRLLTILTYEGVLLAALLIGWVAAVRQS